MGKSKQSNIEGCRRSVYSVLPKKLTYEEKVTNSSNLKSYTTAVTYTGEWKGNVKHGYGVQIWSNGNKYDGEWVAGKRHGSGCFWIADPKTKKLRKQYHGSWVSDMREGMGTFWYENDDRYEGMWVQGARQGTGTLFYKNNDIYIGNWLDDQRSGWGVLKNANGDIYEGEWLHDKKEGRGMHFFKSRLKIYDGEWVNNIAKCGVYMDVSSFSFDYDNDNISLSEITKQLEDNEKNQNQITQLPELTLTDPHTIIEKEVSTIQKSRLAARSAPYISIDEIFTEDELDELRRIFAMVDIDGTGSLNINELKTLLEEIGLSPTQEELRQIMNDMDKNSDGTLSFNEFGKALFLLRANNIISDDLEDIMDEEKS